MQLCIVFVVVASLAAADLASPEEVVLGAPKLCAVLLSQCLVVVVAWAIACQTGVDAANDLMTENDWQLRWCRPSFDLVQFRVADSASAHAQKHCAGLWRWRRQFVKFKRRVRLVK